MGWLDGAAADFIRQDSAQEAELYHQCLERAKMLGFTAEEAQACEDCSLCGEQCALSQ